VTSGNIITAQLYQQFCSLFVGFQSCQQTTKNEQSHHPPGGSHVKRTGVPVGNFEKNLEEIQDPVLWVWLEKEVTNLKQDIISRHIFFASKP